MHHKYRFLNLIVFRFVIYGILTICLTELLRFDAAASAAGTKFNELSYTEFAQTTMLLLLSGIYFYLYLREERFAEISFVLFCVMMACFFREEDALLDRYLYHGSWKLFSLPFVIAAVFMLVSGWQHFLDSLQRFAKSYACGLLLFSMITLYIFSRLLGRKIFWYAVMGEAYLRDVKNAAEECLELYGYVLLLISGLEYALFVYQQGLQRRAVTQADPRSRLIRNLRHHFLSFVSALLVRRAFKKSRRGDGLWF